MMAERENRREKSDRQTRGNRGGGIKCLDGYPPVFQQIIRLSGMSATDWLHRRHPRFGLGLVTGHDSFRHMP